MTEFTEKEKKSGKQYMWEFLPAMMAFMAILIGSQRILSRYPDTIWEIPLKLAPVLPIFFIVRAIVRFISRMDELRKKIFMEAAVVTLLVLMLSVFSYSLLEGQAMSCPDPILVVIIPCLVYLLMFFMVGRKYDGK